MPFPKQFSLAHRMRHRKSAKPHLSTQPSASTLALIIQQLPYTTCQVRSWTSWWASRPSPQPPRFDLCKCLTAEMQDLSQHRSVPSTSLDLGVTFLLSCSFFSVFLSRQGHKKEDRAMHSTVSVAEPWMSAARALQAARCILPYPDNSPAAIFCNQGLVHRHLLHWHARIPLSSQQHHGVVRAPAQWAVLLHNPAPVPQRLLLQDFALPGGQRCSCRSHEGRLTSVRLFPALLYMVGGLKQPRAWAEGPADGVRWESATTMKHDFQ